MGRADDFHQGGNGKNILATEAEKYSPCADNFFAGDDGRLYADGRGSVRQLECGLGVDTGTFAEVGSKYFSGDNPKRSNKKARRYS